MAHNGRRHSAKTISQTDSTEKRFGGEVIGTEEDGQPGNSREWRAKAKRAPEWGAVRWRSGSAVSQKSVGAGVVRGKEKTNNKGPEFSHVGLGGDYPRAGALCQRVYWKEKLG